MQARCTKLLLLGHQAWVALYGWGWGLSRMWQQEALGCPFVIWCTILEACSAAACAPHTNTRPVLRYARGAYIFIQPADLARSHL